MDQSKNYFQNSGVHCKEKNVFSIIFSLCFSVESSRMDNIMESIGILLVWISKFLSREQGKFQR